MGATRPRVLLVEPDRDLRRLDAEILGEAGYAVEVLAAGVEPIAEAARLRPDVVVFALGARPPDGPDVADRFRADPTTRDIPLVVVATSEERAAEAQAAPNVPDTVVAPYDIAALEAAVAFALRHPPPHAAVPAANGEVEPATLLAVDALDAQARHLVIRTLRALQQTDAYNGKFPHLTRLLVDDLGTMLGAILEGLRRQSPPAEVFALPGLREYIANHVTLRRQQGLGPAAAIREYQLLRGEVEAFLPSLVGQHGFDRAAAYEVARRFGAYVDELIRIIVTEYQTSPGN
jgi:CheY-like chemotaxis protein